MSVALITTLIAAFTAIVGVLLGGGVRAWEARLSRRNDAAALLSALVAEVEAITRLMNHRQFIPALQNLQNVALSMIDSGAGAEAAPFLRVTLTQDYLTVFNASTSKLGMLTPYQADRIVRFYSFLKAAMENYHPDSVFQQGVDATSVVEITKNDLELLATINVLGNHIASFRSIEMPAGMTDPFDVTRQGAPQPPLPQSHPEQANASAGQTSFPSQEV